MGCSCSGNGIIVRDKSGRRGGRRTEEGQRDYSQIYRFILDIEYMRRLCMEEKENLVQILCNYNTHKKDHY